MMKKLLIGLFVVVISSVFALNVFAGHASRSRTSGSVITTGSSVVRGGGNIRLDEEIRPLPGDTGIRGIAFCGNPGSKRKVAAGVNPVVPAFSGSTLVKSGQIDRNGRFRFSITSEADTFGLNPAEICPNPNWVIVDFVPLAFESRVTETSIRNGVESPLGYAIDRCVLTGDPTTLKYGERRPYECQIIQETHN
jgi:hypothetical protein